MNSQGRLSDSWFSHDPRHDHGQVSPYSARRALWHDIWCTYVVVTSDIPVQLESQPKALQGKRQPGAPVGNERAGQGSSWSQEPCYDGQTAQDRLISGSGQQDSNPPFTGSHGTAWEDWIA